jgi:hypothetical protein
MIAPIRLALAVVLVSPAAASAQDALAAARDLYASAAYEEALGALVRLKAEASASTTAEIDRYRVLCLMALGRASEADSVIESIVLNDPLYLPSAGETSPRAQAAFNTVRQRVLPDLARRLYADGKSAFDKKSYADATRALEQAVKVIDNIEGERSQAALLDLRTLVTGFLELSRAANLPSPASALAAATPAAAASIEPPPPAVRTSPNVPVPQKALVVLKQELPPVPFSMTQLGSTEYRGLVEVDIDVAGNVTDARMLQPVHPFYDSLLLRASRDWKYEAPRLDGKPMPSKKRVAIVLRP